MVVNVLDNFKTYCNNCVRDLVKVSHLSLSVFIWRIKKKKMNEYRRFQTYENKHGYYKSRV